MKETEQICKVNPEPAIQTAGIESPIHQCIVTFDHHEALTSQTVHRRACIQTPCLAESIHHQCQATGQQSSAKDRGAKRKIRAGSAAGRGSVEQVTYATLYHQHRESEQCADSKPPSKGSHWDLQRRAPVERKQRPSATVAEGRQAVKKTCPLFTPPRDRRRISLTEGARREQSPLSILDGERWRHFHCRCPP